MLPGGLQALHVAFRGLKQYAQTTYAKCQRLNEHYQLQDHNKRHPEESLG